jgi:hypothetical protein
MASKKGLKNRAEASRARSAARTKGASRSSQAKQPLYNRRQANRISLWIIVAVAILLGGYIAVESAIDPASVAGGQLRLRSLFGYSLPLSEISDLKLEQGALATGSRIFGNDAFGVFREGDFVVDGLGTTRVFLKRPHLSYLTFRTEEKSYAIDLGSAEKNQKLYDEIKLGSK